MESEWSHFLQSMALALVRISGTVALVPFFSSNALPMQAKAVFSLAVAYLLAPVVAGLPGSTVELSFTALLGEFAIGLVYGLSLALLNEILLFAGQIVGLQLSFSLVNLLDPASSIQTPLMSELFQLMGTLIVIKAGLDRLMMASLVRSFHVVPLGGFALTVTTSDALVRAAGGVFLSAVQLAAPVLASTLLVEVTIALLARISPQLPVISLTVPLKTLTGFALMAGSLSLWTRFVATQFTRLLNGAEKLISIPLGGG